MTVSSIINTVEYNGNGATVEFPFPYLFYAKAHLTVTVINAAGSPSVKVLDTDYTVSGEGLDEGGAVTFTTAPITGETVIIQRIVPLTQLIDYINGGAFPAETHERGLDLLTMIGQQLDEQLERTLTLQVGSEGDFEISGDRENTIIGFDNNGDIRLYTPNDAGVATLIPQVIAVSAGQTVVTVNEYQPNTNTQLYFLNNVALFVDTGEVTETSATSITLSTAPVAESTLIVISLVSNDIGVADAANVSYAGGTTVQRALDNFQFDALAEMAAITAPEGTGARIQQGGRAGPFRATTADISTQVTADPQQGVYVAFSSDPTGSSGGWVRQYGQSLSLNPAVRAEWFGAVGDGVTDDTAAIQSALAAVQASKGGFIDFPQGVFNSDPFTVPTGVVLRGAGPNHESMTPDTGTVLNILATRNCDAVTLAESATSCGLQDITVRIRNSEYVNAIVRSFGVLRPILDRVEAEYGNDGALNPGRLGTGILNCTDNGSGAIRITTETPHPFVTGNIVDVENVQGTVEANGPWKVTVIDSLTVDLDGSTFTNAYIGGTDGIFTLGAGFLMDNAATTETLYANLRIISHTANSGLVLWDDSNAIGVSADSTLQGQFIPMRLLGQESFNTGFICLAAVEGNYGAFGSTMKHEFIPEGTGIVDAIAPVDMYICPLIEVQKGEGVSFPGGYFETGGIPGTYDDGVNGVHPLYPVVKIGPDVSGLFSRAINRARYFDLGTATDVTTTGYKGYDTRNKPTALLRTNSAQSVPAFALTPIDFSAQVLDADVTFFKVAGDTITVHQDGAYRISAVVNSQALPFDTGSFFLRVLAGGVGLRGPINTGLSGQGIGAGIDTSLKLKRGDTIQIQLFQGTGANVLLTPSFEDNHLSIEKV